MNNSPAQTVGRVKPSMGHHQLMGFDPFDFQLVPLATKHKGFRSFWFSIGSSRSSNQTQQFQGETNRHFGI